MVFDMILVGLGDIFGYELVVALLLMFSFIIMIISRGAGVTAVIGTFFLSVYLFANNKIGDYYLLTNDWLLTVVLLVGLFMGFLVYMLFWR